MDLALFPVTLLVIGQVSSLGSRPVEGRDVQGVIPAESPVSAPASESPSASDTEPAVLGATEPLVPLPRSGGNVSPATIVREALEPPAEDPLPGVDVTLYEVISGTLNRAAQAALVQAYWDLSAAVANYRIGIDERQSIERLVAADIQQRAAGYESLELALAEAQVRVVEARLAAVEAQHRLAALRAAPPNSALPIPADRPHVGPYRTRYEELFATQPATPARELHATLPIHCDVVRARAAAVGVATRAAAGAEQPASGGRSANDAVLECERLAKRRRGFIAAVRDYNLRIAQYAALVATEPSDPVRMHAMLIKPNGATGPAPNAPSDGLSSVLKRRSGQPHPAQSASPSMVGPATAVEPVPAGTSHGQTNAQPDDGFVPRRPGLDP